MVEWPEGYGRRILAEVDSTNAEGVRCAATLSEPTWIMTHRQTAGRGRRGRPWSEPVKNFAGSLVLRPSEAPGVAALRSFVSALALSDAVLQIAPHADVALKWPNDVLLSGGKLAGILLESSGQGGRLTHLVIGIGVNLYSTPEGVAPGVFAPVSLREATGVEVSQERFLTHLAAAYAAREAVFVRDGFAPIRAAWLERAARLGEVIVARTGTTETTGRFETVDADGALVLSTADGRRVIPAADVFF
ncbi:biotin--[acetyl-CoA-carboxylase] ligase [Roseovarius aestuarii]|nr:biotin--[acetyl-CoA-carboxylase] ligase [Roseovarius aestuarii]